jgi:hypothetical protein
MDEWLTRAGLRRPQVRTTLSWTLTALAGLLLFLALAIPHEFGLLTPAAFLRVPLEVILFIALVLVLPVKARRIVALVGGALLGLVTVIRFIDMGFRAAFDRPFHPSFDWSFFGPAVDFVERSWGKTGSIVAVIIAVVLAVALPVVLALAARRIASVVALHRTAAVRTAGVLAIIWTVCAVLAVQIVPGVPVATASASRLGLSQTTLIAADLRDRVTFKSVIAADAFRETPPSDLLTALRGKDVIVAFVESYGRVAVEDPQIAPRIDSLLDGGERRLASAGYSARSAFLTSPTAGGASWLAHATLQSGLWINTPTRYDALFGSDRLTLSRAFREAGWRTVGVLPANRTDWPEGAAFYGFQHIYDSRNIGYRGPDFSFATIPDQYTLAAFQRSERGSPNRQPVMAEISLVSSHAPWSPVPPLLDWSLVGDGSSYTVPDGAHDPANVVFQRELAKVKSDFANSIAYSLQSLLSYVDNYGDENLVLVIVGDHQPAPIIAGDEASRDAPVTIVAGDPAVLDRITEWGWEAGLNPSPAAQVWGMDEFRNRFLTAFGPHP